MGVMDSDFSEIENTFNFNQDDFDIILEDINPGLSQRVLKPRLCRTKQVSYNNAKKLANDIDFNKSSRYFVFVSGNFIFGDFIEAFIIKNNINVLQLNISTLSLSQNNVDSLKNLMEAGYVQELNIIVSDYFFSHERKNLIKYMYDNLDIDNKFQLAVCRSHCKISQILTEGGKKITIHGSVNLRSSDNMEQFVIEDNEDIFDFNKIYFDSIISKYNTINKSIKSKQLWQVVAKNTNT